MSDIEAILARHREWAGAPMAVATVISTWGSAPRPRGSHMLVHADGRFEGSVSGGCVEGAVLEAGERAIASGRFERLRFGVADNAAWEVGLPCGGEIEVLVQPVTGESFAPNLFAAVEEARDTGHSIVLATDLESGRTEVARSNGDGFRNRYPPARRLLIVGAVQIAQALAALAGTIGYRVSVIDPRARFLTAERFPNVELDDRWPDEAIAARRPDAATAIVTLSHDIKIDDPALSAALASPAFYIAALGSRRSHAARLERLGGEGFSAAELSRIEGPAGIAIGAIGASEIALSIAAGMVQAFNRAPAEAAAPAGAAA